MRRASFTLIVFCLGALAIGTAFAAAPVPDFPIGGKGSLLRECADLQDPRRERCYIRGLLAAVEKSGDPARELPRIDGTVGVGGGYLQANCHIFMHEVGRTWARKHGVTLETLYRYVPKSNDPGCSAGFGMGMVMHLGTKLVLDPRATIPVCDALPTRFRQYTCVHGSGHAFMRGYHGILESAVHACKLLGARLTPDCAQGAFHDYWISLGGGDGTKRASNADADPRSVCKQYAYPRPCWYRYFWERRQGAQVDDERDVARLCAGVTGLQRVGCIGGASLLVVRVAEPVDHSLLCGRLTGPDAMSCLRGVNVPALLGDPWAQLRLLRTCSTQPASTRTDCYRWFGRTLNVVTDGWFARTGCPKLQLPEARDACLAGAKRFGEPLATFS